ncbi:MAG: SGNH/GDSL hydrolase family protein [Armatimonadota bacterium]
MFHKVLFVIFALIPLVLCAHAQQSPTSPPQIPFCMIGDSITRAGVADYWREYLLEEIPTMAYVGTHSASLGYSHAGEGGDSTHRVLGRIDDIPDCPYYHLLIGTNDDNAAKEGAQVEKVAQRTSGRIIEIVNGLLQKPSMNKVFLASVLPCATDNPFRDKTNSRVNQILKEQFDELWPDGRVAWVEYEEPIRATEQWEPKIRLHPTREGYRLLAEILADTLREKLNLPEEIAAPEPKDGTGVGVVNLWEGDADGHTTAPVLADFYTISFDAIGVGEDGGTVTVRSQDGDLDYPLQKSFDVPADAADSRLDFTFFTGHERRTYTRSVWEFDVEGCTIDRILIEKKRPNAVPSVYGTGTYVDYQTPPAPGELVVW